MKKSLLFGSLGALSLGTILMCSSVGQQEGVYQERTSTFHEAGTANEYFKEMKMMKGDFDSEDWRRAYEQLKTMDRSRSSLDWIEQGPDNIGGRTRAICIDRNDVNHLWAGSVSGGLFESTNRAGYWKRVETWTEEMGISSMVQTIDGTLYVSTNHQREGGMTSEGSGSPGGTSIYYKLDDGTFELIPGTTAYTYVNQLRCDSVTNLLWYCTNTGLWTYDPATGDKENMLSGSVGAFDMTGDGNLIVAVGTGNKTQVSNDGGITWTDVSGTGATQVPSGGVGRIEYAISKEPGTDGEHRIYASLASNTSRLKGVYRSADSGMTWEEIAPENDLSPGSFSPFDVGGGGQGMYNNIVTVVPGSPNRMFLGGIDCYSWASTGNWTQISQWFLHPSNDQYVHADNHEMVWDQNGRLYIGNDGGVSFSDDAKISSSPTFKTANRGYNVTQFYHSSFSAHGDVLGGSQDNGTLANYHDNSTWQEFDQVGGGDGFGCEMSFINRDILFSTVYYSSIRRSNDRGENSTNFSPQPYADDNGCTLGALDGTGCGQFNTRIQLWEDPDDEDSEDTITFIPSQAYSSGDVVEVPSLTSQTIIDYTTTEDLTYDDTLIFDPTETTEDIIIKTQDPGAVEYNLTIVNWTFVFGAPTVDVGDTLYLVDLDSNIVVDSVGFLDHFWGTNSNEPGELVDMGNDTVLYNIAWDTLMVPDPYQSWFVLGGAAGEGVWMTRNALRFSSEPNWIKVADESGMGTVTCLEFSKDGEHLFIGTSGGQLYRLTGHNDVYSPIRHDATIPGFEGDSLLDWDRGHYATTLTQIDGSFGGRPVLGIAPGPISDPDHLVVALGGSSGDIRETNNATGASVSWSSIASDLPNTPYYAAVIDRDDPSIMVVGGELGAYLSENGGSSWEPCSGEFQNVPVFDLGQNWRTFDEGNIKPGTIYAGTHGRGIWSSDAYLNVDSGTDQLEVNKFVPNITVYPNPMKDDGAIKFDLDTDSDVTVQIFNLQGQVVSEINQKGMSAGTNNLTFGTAGLTPGTYIVRLSAGEMIETAKFIKH